MSTISDWGQVVVGIAGLVNYAENRKAAQNAANTANQIMGQASGTQDRLLSLAEGEAGQVSQTREQLSRLAAAALRDIDVWDEGTARAVGIYEAVLGGEQAGNLNVPGVQDQFDIIDDSLAAEIRDIEKTQSVERERIARNVTGGAKLRLLAEVASKSQDLKGAAISKAKEAKRQKNLELTNALFTDALSIAKVAPAQRTEMLSKAGSMLTNQPSANYANMASQFGLSPAAQLTAATGQLTAAQQGQTALGQLAGLYLSRETQDKTGEITRVPQQAVEEMPKTDWQGMIQEVPSSGGVT